MLGFHLERLLYDEPEEEKAWKPAGFPWFGLIWLIVSWGLFFWFVGLFI